MKKAFKIIFYPIIGVLGLFILYLFFAWIGMLIPINNERISEGKDIEIFIQSNGLHADFVLPTVHEVHNWEEVLPLSRAYSGQLNYISLGWGEKNFYLNTPTMSDLTFPTLVKALFIPSEAAMHVDYRRYKPAVNDDVKSIMISEEMYLELVDYIMEFFVTEEGEAKLYPDSGYDEYDDFYAAYGKYHAFWTCNNWTNTGLKKIGIKNSLWTPMDWGVLYYLE